MSSLRLISNVSNNSLPNLGNAFLESNNIIIKLHENANAFLLRNGKEILLADNNHKTIKISGKCQVDDVYILDNGVDKLTITVKEDIIENPVQNNPYIEQNNLINTGISINNDSFYEAKDKKQKNMLSIGIVLLLLLIVSVVFGVRQKNKLNFEKNSEEILISAQSDYQKSLELKDVDIQSSRDYFSKAKESITKLNSSGYKDSRLSDLISKMNISETDILGEKKVEIKEYLDLTLQVNSFSGTDLVSSGKQMFVFDKDLKSIIQVDIANKKAKIVAGKDKLEDIQKIASYEDKLFGIGDNGLFRLDGEKSKLKDKDWDDPLFYLYSANIYLVDRSNSKIYRYSGNTQGKNITFGEKNEWVAPGINVDLSKTQDISIDGSIWVLNSTGRIQKFTNGNPLNINTEGLILPLKNPETIYTNEELKYVYLLDKQNERVVVIEKNGKFKMQFSGPLIKEADDLVVSEKENKAILLSKSKLYSFDLGLQ